MAGAVLQAAGADNVQRIPRLASPQQRGPRRQLHLLQCRADQHAELSVGEGGEGAHAPQRAARRVGPPLARGEERQLEVRARQEPQRPGLPAPYRRGVPAAANQAEVTKRVAP